MERQLIKRGLNRIILLPIVLSLVYAGVVVWQLNRMLHSNEWVLHSTQVLQLSSEVQRHIQAQESALRGYELLPDSLFLAQFRREENKVDSVFELLHVQTLDNPPQTEHLDTLMQMYWTWQSSARHALSTAVAANLLRYPIHAGMQADTEVAMREKTASAIRAGFGRVITIERELYHARIEEFQHGTTTLLLIIAIASIGAGTLAGFYARRQAQAFIHRLTRAVDETTQNRDLLATTLLSIDDAVIVTETNGTITMMNARALDLTGWAWTEAKGRMLSNVFRVVSEENRAPMESSLKAIAQSKTAIRFKERLLLLSRTGVEYPIEETVTPVCNSNQEAVAIVLVFRDITELRESERASAQREQEFRALIENAPDLIVRYASDRTVTYANPAIEHALGIPPKTLIGRHFSEIGISEEMYGAWERAVEEVFRTGNELSLETVYRAPRGARTYQVRLVPEERTESNAVRTVIAIARDITELKQIEQRLRESEQRFRGIVENSPDAFFLLRAVREDRRNPQSTIVDFAMEFINQHGAELLTIPISDLVGKKLSEVMPGDRPRQFIEHYSSILASGVAASQEYRIETPYVRARWLHSQYIPLGELLAVMTSDITERMQTTFALERSEERYRRMVEHASEAIFSTDANGCFTYANPYVRELGGYRDEDISHYHFTDLIVPEYRERVKRHFLRQVVSKTPMTKIDVPFIRRSGGDQWLAVTAVLDVEGTTVRGFDCIGTDITDRREMQEELNALKHPST